MRGISKITFFGGMDLDTALEYVKQGFYRLAKNIIHLTDNTGSSQTILPMKGNVLAFSLDSVAVQNKTIRVYVTQTAGAGIEGGLAFSSNGVGYTQTITSVVPPNVLPNHYPFNVAWNFSQSIAGMGADLTTNALLNFGINTGALQWYNSVTVAFTVTGTTTTGEDIGYIDISFNLITGYDFEVFGRVATVAATPVLITDTPLTIVTLQEPYDISLTGELNPIGSFDSLSNLFVWSTPQTNLPAKKTLTVSSVADNGSGRYRVVFSSLHGLIDGHSIQLSNTVITAIALEGIWIISVINPITIDLREYFENYVAIGTTNFPITITTNISGIGEIGVAQFNANTDAWTYTMLARTKQWNFRTKKQPDTHCESTANKDSIYWTDDFNVPRVLYYIKEYDDNGNLLPYDTNGVISTINPTGSYTFETIEQETRLQLSTSGAKITFKQQLQSGGQVPSGNWRYATRFLTEALTATEPSDITNPINVYSAATNGSAYLIIGDEPSTITGKINQLEVTGILPGLFKYIELIGVNYVGDGIVGLKIRRELLDPKQTSIILNHTGTETDTTNFDLGLLNQQFAQIETARNMTVIDKRMILSNLTTKQRTDFTAWALTFEHILFKREINAVRRWNLRMGEYQDPVNVNNFVGYMHNETYRFGVKVRFKNGEVSDVFFIDDVIFNTEAINSAGTEPTRRISGLSDFNLTDHEGTYPNNQNNVFVAAIRFEYNLDFKIDGIPVKDLIESISIERAEVINPTILASGMGVLSVEHVAVHPFDSVGGYYYIASVPPNTPAIGEYPFISGRIANPENPLYANTGTNRDRTVLAFYSPDIEFNHTSIVFADGDKILNHGNPSRNYMSGHDSIIASNSYSQYGEWTGFFGANGIQSNPIPLVKSAVFVNSGAEVTLTGTIPGKIYRKKNGISEIY